MTDFFKHFAAAPIPGGSVVLHLAPDGWCEFSAFRASDKMQRKGWKKSVAEAQHAAVEWCAGRAEADA